MTHGKERKSYRSMRGKFALTPLPPLKMRLRGKIAAKWCVDQTTSDFEGKMCLNTTSAHSPLSTLIAYHQPYYSTNVLKMSSTSDDQFRAYVSKAGPLMHRAVSPTPKSPPHKMERGEEGAGG
jgi:hypothetical protein